MSKFKLFPLVNPYKNSDQSKKQQVEKMFDSIAFRYDFLNHFLSLGIDKVWRRKTVQQIARNHPKTILDVATGTGDLAIACLKLNPDAIKGIDLSAGMLQKGREKIEKKKLSKKIKFVKGDSEKMPFSDKSFDALTCGFGVRNFENLEKGLFEFYRVLKPGGIAAILEFSKPTAFPVKQMYYFYFKQILPLTGKIFSKSDSAYSYLPESVAAFPEGKDFTEKLDGAGFIQTSYNRLTFGIATLYTAVKPDKRGN